MKKSTITLSQACDGLVRYKSAVGDARTHDLVARCRARIIQDYDLGVLQHGNCGAGVFDRRAQFHENVGQERLKLELRRDIAADLHQRGQLPGALGDARLQLPVGFAQGRLGPLPLRDISEDETGAQAAVAIRKDGRRELDREARAVAPDHRQCTLHLACAPAFFQHFVQTRACRIHDPRPASSADVFLRTPQQATRRRVRGQDAAVGHGEQHTVDAMLVERTKARLAFAQLGFGVPALGDIGK